MQQALPAPYAPAREQPDLVASLLVPEEQDPPAPPEDRRDADPRLPHPQCADEPKPRSPRELAGELGHLDEPDGRDRGDHELRDPHAWLDGELLSCVRVEEDDADLAAIAGVDEARAS